MRELLAGVLSFLLGAGCMAVAIRRGGRAVKATFRAALAIEALVASSVFLDWCYDWVEVRAVDLAMNSNVWIGLPSALAVLALASAAAWGARATPSLAGLAALQAASFPVVLELVGRDQDMSFLAPAPLASEYLSVVAAFLFLPAACATVPEPGSRWHAVAFGPRSGLIEAIRGLAELGLAVAAPASVLESGTASGRVAESLVRVTTAPSLLPPRYALRVEVERPGEGPVPAAPGFARRESVSARGRVVRYIGLSPRSFDVTSDALRAFVAAMACSTAANPQAAPRT